MRQVVRVFILCCLSALLPVRAIAAVPSADPPFYFLALADIHFDPFAACRSTKSACPMISKLRSQPVSAWGATLAAADTKLPGYRQDANYPLLRQVLQEAQKAAVNYHPDFVLVLGDTLGHNFRRDYRRYTGDRSAEGWQSFARKTLEFVNASMIATFPGVNVFMVVGNNDTYSANYQSVPDGAFFRETGALWSSLIVNPADRDSMRKEFAHAGYYAVNVPNHPNMRLIVLNSVLFSKRSSGAASQQAAFQQLDWLHQELLQAKDHQQQVLIAMHIPPRIDMYLMGRIRLFTAQQFFQPVYMARLTQELTAFYPEVTGMIAGHLHYDWTQAMRVGYRHELPVIGVPSVSPFFGNLPAFKVYHYVPAVAHIDDIYTYSDIAAEGQSWRIIRSFF